MELSMDLPPEDGTLRVEVTGEHILRGVRGDRGCCPIALAIKDLGFQNPAVGLFCASAFKDGVRHDWFLSLGAASFIQQFDMGGRVAPFAFDMRPTSSVRVGLSELGIKPDETIEPIKMG